MNNKYGEEIGTRRRDGSVVMPPMSYLAQAEYFKGFVAGYALAIGMDLWSSLDATTMCVDFPNGGTRSQKLQRADLLDGGDLNAALCALLDSNARWPKATPMHLLATGEELYSAPVQPG